MKDVGLKCALVPLSGVNSALGCTIADMRHDFVQTVNSLLDDLDVSDLVGYFTNLAKNGHSL